LTGNVVPEATLDEVKNLRAERFPEENPGGIIDGKPPAQ
jgi:hypothetical protein